MRLRKAVERALFIVICLLVVRLYLRIPFNDDSFLPYSNIAWSWYPLNRLEPLSGIWDLAVWPDRYLPLRAETYIGSLSSIIYFPLFLLWPSPHSARLLGVFALGAQALIMHRLCGFGALKTFLLLLAFMPYAFQHVTDTSVAGIQIAIILLIVLMIERWSSLLTRGARPSCGYPVLAGLLVFLGVWAKLSFLFYLPVIPLFLLRAAVRNRAVLRERGPRRRFLLHVAVAAAVAGVLTGALLTARCGSGGSREMPYYAWGGICMDIGLEERGYDYSSPARHLAGMTRYLTNPLLAAGRVSHTDKNAPASGVALFGVTVLLLLYGAVRRRRRPEDRGFIIVNVCAGAAVVIAVVFSPAAYSMYHLLMAYPFPLLILFLILSRLRGDRLVAALLALFIGLNLWQYYRLSGMDYRDWERVHLAGFGLVPNFECLREALDRHADTHVFIHGDWGTYYIKALYGRRDQCNIWAAPLAGDDGLDKVHAACERTGRGPMFIVLREQGGSDIGFIRSRFPGLVRLDLDCDAGSWEIWYVPRKRSRYHEIDRGRTA
ncbi:MAG: hypothetical protein PHN82_03815 [bacterium]|nr:hypothetical protein [bacterium]